MQFYSFKGNESETMSLFSVSHCSPKSRKLSGYSKGTAISDRQMPGFSPHWLPGPHFPSKRSSLQPSLGSLASRPQTLSFQLPIFISIVTSFLFCGSSHPPYREGGEYAWGETCFPTEIPSRGWSLTAKSVLSHHTWSLGSTQFPKQSTPQLLHH